jgi:phosphotransferase system enzyme I (PtsI)
MMNEQLKGIAAAPGISMGKAFLLGKEEFIVSPKEISEEEIPLEIMKFEDALTKTRRQILDLKKKISEELGKEEEEIFEAHLLVLEDRMLIEEVISRIKQEKKSSAYIFQDVLKKYIQIFKKMEDEYLRERVSDIQDVGRRVLRNLLDKKTKTLEDITERVIIVAYDLSPSDTASMSRKTVCGFVTDIGGKTSHTAIMAKSLQIPAVVGIEIATEKIKTGDFLIVDGNRGIVIISPDEQTLEVYKSEEKKLIDIKEVFLHIKDLPAQTLDGKRVELAANIELPEEIPLVLESGAEGIGLYRTEFFYMNREDLPTEEEHYQAYRTVAEAFYPNSVIIRTLDLGGDKFLSQLKVPKDMLPFLGWRAVRFCLARPDIFKTQLKAILRASIHRNLKLMYPMISGIEELRQANSLLEEAKEELRKDGIGFDENIQVGVMIEVPSAALTSDILAKESDFFSIGTNDLIQYSLAIDRTNEKISYLYEPSHPAVLRLIKNVIEAAHCAGIWVGMCGEMASEPIFAFLLLGLGLDEFSIPPQSIPQIKQLIRSVTLEEAKEVASACLKLSTGREVEEFTKERLNKILKDARYIF